MAPPLGRRNRVSLLVRTGLSIGLLMLLIIMFWNSRQLSQPPSRVPRASGPVGLQRKEVSTVAPSASFLPVEELEKESVEDHPNLITTTAAEDGLRNNNIEVVPSPKHLSRQEEGILLKHAAAQLEGMLDSTRALLVEARQRHAERVGIAPVRACFVSMVRHSDEGLKRFHRLLINVRQSMPLMAGRYPFVAFHEHEADPDALYRQILRLELKFQQATESYGNAVRSHSWELKNVEDLGGQVVRNEDPLTSPHDAQVLTERLVQGVSSGDVASLQGLARRFVFPKTVTHPDPQVRNTSRYGWPLTMGVISGLTFAAMPREDFGVIPSSVDTNREWPYPKNSYWGVSYRHMCRFFGVRIFYTEFFQQNHFDYYMRLDVDSYILSTPIRPVWVETELDEDRSKRRYDEADYFEAMRDNEAAYAFSMLHPQRQTPFLVDLEPTFSRISREVGVAPGGLSAFPFPSRDMVHYWDNVEIVNLNWFRELPSREQVEERHAAELEHDKQLPDACKECHYPSDARVGLNPLRWGVEDFRFVSLPLSDEDIADELLDMDALVQEITAASKDWENHEDALIDAITLAVRAEGFVSSLREASMKQTQSALSAHNERAHTIKRFLDKFDESGGFYYHRWGDAELRTLTMSTFVPADKIYWMESLPYQHYMNFHCPQYEHVKSVRMRESQKQCEGEAMKTYGQDNKQRGSARMSPAEASHYNHAFEKLREETGGWPSM